MYEKGAQIGKVRDKRLVCKFCQKQNKKTLQKSKFRKQNSPGNRGFYLAKIGVVLEKSFFDVFWVAESESAIAHQNFPVRFSQF